MPEKDRDKHKKNAHAGHEDVEAALSSEHELREVRDAEVENRSDGSAPNVFVNTMNVFTGGAKSMGRGVRMVCDPVLKVCYPAARQIATAGRTVCDPVLKVCYPPLKSHWEAKYKRRFPKHAGWVLALDLALLFLLGSLVVGLMFVKMVLPAFPSPDLVRMQLLRPATAVSGEPTSIILAYGNSSDEPLAGAELRVELPEQFVTTATTPSPEGADAPTDISRARFLRFFIGSVPPNGRGEVRIDGTLYGPLGSSHIVASEFLYWREGDTAPRREASFHTLAVTDSHFTLGLAFDEPFLRGSRNGITVSYGNQGEEPIVDAEVRLSPPAGFTVTGSVPPTATPNAWRLGTLEPGARGTITVYGVLSERAVPSFIARAYAGDGDRRLLAQEVRGNIDAISTGFTLDHDVSGATSGARPGETIDVKVRYHNGGEHELADVAIRLEATSRYLKDTVPAWTGGDLDRVAPGETGTLTATLHVKDDIPAELLEGDAVPTLRIAVVGEYALAEEPGRILRIDSGVTEVPIATRLGLEGGSIYRTKDGEQLGVGPVPPRVGESTRLWTVLKVTNGSNEAAGARLEATLPPGVRWTGRFSVTAGEPIAYLPQERRLIWDVGTIPAYSDGAHAGASIELEFTPEPEDVGSAPALIENIRLTATDAPTGIRVHATAEAVTTGVRFGSEEERGGVVRE